MKKTIYLLFIFMFLSGITYAGVITVSSPALNSEWCINKPNQPLQIRWVENPKENEFVKIRLYNSDLTVQVFKIVDSTENDGVFDWVIPASIQPGKYRIRVRSLNNLASGDSRTFWINQCTPPEPSGETSYARETYVPPKSPDLKASMFCNPDSPAVDQESEIEFKVKNIGDKDSAACIMRVLMGTMETDKWDVPIIKPGRHFAVTKEFIPDRIGQIHWSLHVDKEKVSGDRKLENNIARKIMLIRGPDLTITKILSTTQRQLAIFKKCIIEVKVKNIGEANVDSFEVHVDFDTCPGIAKALDWKKHRGGLAPGEEVVFQFDHRYKCYGIKVIKAYVDKFYKVKESDKTNNTASTKVKIAVRSNYLTTDDIDKL